MKTGYLSRLVILLFLMSAVLSGQTGPAQKSKRFGLGVSILNTDLPALFHQRHQSVYPATTINMIIPLFSVIRLEPEAGYSQSYQLYDYSPGQTKKDSRVYTLGAGIVYVLKRERVAGYAGLRGGYASYSRISSQRKDSDPVGDFVLLSEKASKGIYFAPVFGIEYAFSSNLALGAEAQIGFISYLNSSDLYTSSAMHLTTKTLLSLRFYL